MITRVLAANSPSAVEEAAKVIREGGLVALPTDTVYGVGADPFNPGAVDKIFAAKGRAVEKAIPVLLSDVQQLSLVAEHYPPALKNVAEKFWPGGITVILPKSPKVPDVVTSGGPTIAVRIPNHPVALALIRAVGGALATTSANRSGRPSPKTAEEVRSELEGAIDVILDGGRVPGGVESTVIDLTRDVPVVLRQGAISVEELERVLGQRVRIANRAQ